MTLSFDQIWSAVQGAVCREESGGCLALRRFTPVEQEKYRQRRPESYLRSFATAGIRLEFETESPWLFLRVQVLPSTSRRWFCHSVFADGKRIGELSGQLGPEETCREYEKRFCLGPGRKRVTVCLPWSVESRIRELSLEEGAGISPVKKELQLLSYGDSITQGYDAASPEEAYIVRLAEALEAELTCKAIGGERFWPELPGLSGPLCPDLITVAYGANDWRLSGREEFLRDSRAFFRELRRLYPQVPILALAPIWRADRDTAPSQVGDFGTMALHYQAIAREVPGMRVIDCYDFVPKAPSSFADGKLHPNSQGFRHYSENLLKALREQGFKLRNL